MSEGSELQPTPPRHWRVVFAILAFAALAVVFIAVGGPFGKSSAREYPSRPLGPDSEPVLVPPPPIDEEFFPCDDCHEDDPADPLVRELDEHDSIELAHGDLW